MHRRHFVISAAATALMPVCSGQAADTGTVTAAETAQMYGLIGKMRATPGQREALIAILLGSVGEMPGCLSYVVAKDTMDADGIWITEVWDDAVSHKASLQLPAVREAITRAKPLIAGFDQSFATEPVGGFGLPGARR
jgi:quinol monooxygenase YgiN